MKPGNQLVKTTVLSTARTWLVDENVIKSFRVSFDLFDTPGNSMSNFTLFLRLEFCQLVIEKEAVVNVEMKRQPGVCDKSCAGMSWYFAVLRCMLKVTDNDGCAVAPTADRRQPAADTSLRLSRMSPQNLYFPRHRSNALHKTPIVKGSSPTTKAMMEKPAEKKRRRPKIYRGCTHCRYDIHAFQGCR